MMSAPITPTRPLSAEEAEAAFMRVLDEHDGNHEVAPATPPSPLPTPIKQPIARAVQDLLSLDDDRFVESAYHAILGRAPDPQGRHYYLHALAGGRSRILVLGALRYCAEGRALARPVPGLRTRFLLHRLYGLGTAGRALRTLTAIAALPGLMADNQHLWREAALVRDDLRDLAAALQTMRAHVQSLGADMRREMTQHADDAERHRRRLAERLEEDLGKLIGRLDDEPWADPIVLLADRADALAGRLEVIGRAAERAETFAQNPRALPDPTAALSARLGLDALYVAFEDRFRGTRADIKQRQSVYLDLLLSANAGTQERPIVDVGSGRGEFLELLGEAGLVARGVDLNAAMVAECGAYELACTHADALAYLEAIEPGSLGAVTGFHIIEHLPFAVMVALFDASLRALASGGLVIFETPNPANVTVASRWFHLDPTHRSPLPAEMVSMIAEARGFTNIDIRELHPMPGRFEAHDKRLAAQLDGLFHGPQDYALIARKGT